MARTPLRLIELLVSVAETGSIGGAARALNVAQPTVSAQLRQLERQVGATLLRRTARGSSLTPAGEVVAGWARDVLTASDRFEAGVTALHGARAARLRLSASMTIAEYLVPGWVAGLRRRHPDVVAAVRVANSEQVAADVLSGAADLGFVEGPRTPDGLAERVVATDRLVAVVSAHSGLGAASGRCEAHELAHSRLVLRESGSGTREVFEQAMAERGFAVRAAVELGSTAAIRSALGDPELVGVLSSLATADAGEAGLRTVDVCDLDLGRTLRAVWPVGKTPTPLVTEFVTLANHGVARIRGASPAAGAAARRMPRSP